MDDGKLVFYNKIKTISMEEACTTGFLQKLSKPLLRQDLAGVNVYLEYVNSKGVFFLSKFNIVKIVKELNEWKYFDTGISLKNIEASVPASFNIFDEKDLELSSRIKIFGKILKLKEDESSVDKSAFYYRVEETIDEAIDANIFDHGFVFIPEYITFDDYMHFKTSYFEKFSKHFIDFISTIYVDYYSLCDYIKRTKETKFILRTSKIELYYSTMSSLDSEKLADLLSNFSEINSIIYRNPLNGIKIEDAHGDYLIKI